MISGIFCRSIEKGFFKGEKDAGMNSKVKIQKVSRWSICLTLVLTVLVSGIGIWSMRESQMLKNATDRYIECEEAARQLQTGVDYLTEQVRMYVLTGEREYMEKYINEAAYTRRRETAVEQLGGYFEGTKAFDSLKTALEYSNRLMDTELYAMHLMAEATGVNMDTCPEQVKKVELSDDDRALSDAEKISKAQMLVSGRQYQKSKLEITNCITAGTDIMTEQTKNRQSHAEDKVEDMYWKLGIGIACLVLLMIEMCYMVRRLIVKPLVNYNECIREGAIFPIVGAEELQNLAKTYNQVYEENLETQRLIRHEAEYDALTDLMNRGSFDRVLQIYKNGDTHYALILVDVDIFKSVNDTYGHAVGDQILKKVAKLLKQMFRSIDFVCRIGGDEFAIVMVEMTSDLGYTIEEKIQAINEELASADDGLPTVSVSVGVAFSDRENPGEDIFKDADKALYRTKENGKCGCSIY